MKDFINDCFDYYTFALVLILWMPIMFICLPVALVAVCMKIAYTAVNESFSEDKNE